MDGERPDEAGRANARARGASKFEFALVVIVLGILATVLLERVQVVQAVAEKTSAEAVLQNMRTGLRFRVAELRFRQSEREVAALAGGNPMRWLERPPGNFVGELRAPQADEVEPGNWYFDLASGEIRYRVKQRRYFVAGPSGRPELRLRVTAGSVPPGAEPYAFSADVNLTPVEPYNWNF